MRLSMALFTKLDNLTVSWVVGSLSVFFFFFTIMGILMKGAGAKHLRPFCLMKGWQFILGSCNSGKPVITNNMELRSDGSSVQVKDQRCSAGVKR